MSHALVKKNSLFVAAILSFSSLACSASRPIKQEPARIFANDFAYKKRRAKEKSNLNQSQSRQDRHIGQQTSTPSQREEQDAKDKEFFQRAKARSRQWLHKRRQDQKQDAEDKSFFERAKARSRQWLSTRQQACLQRIKSEVSERLRSRGVRGFSLGSINYKSHNGRRIVVVDMRKTGSKSLQGYLCKGAVVHSPCERAHQVALKCQSPLEIKKHLALMLNFKRGRAALWRLRINSAHFYPLRKGRRCWDFGCSRRDRNRLRSFMKRRIKERIERYLKRKAKQALIKHAGMTLLQASLTLTVGAALLRYVIKRKSRPDPYLIAYAVHRVHKAFPEKDKAIIRSITVSRKRVFSLPMKKDRFVYRSKRYFGFYARRGDQVQIQAFDKDVTGKQYMGSAAITLTKSVATGSQTCIRGVRDLYQLCFTLHHPEK